MDHRHSGNGGQRHLEACVRLSILHLQISHALHRNDPYSHYGGMFGHLFCLVAASDKSLAHAFSDEPPALKRHSQSCTTLHSRYRTLNLLLVGIGGFKLFA
jgi:hypothetical protein